MGKAGIRHHTYCGPNRPKQLFRSTGNMALVQYRLPVPGVGFLIRVTFPLNPKRMFYSSGLKLPTTNANTINILFILLAFQKLVVKN